MRLIINTIKINNHKLDDNQISLLSEKIVLLRID